MRRIVIAILLILAMCAGCDAKAAKSQTDQTPERMDCAAANLAAAGSGTTIKC